MMTQDGMLHVAQRPHQDSSILRWGGLAGIGGSVLLVVVFAIVGIFAGPEPAGPAGPISRFPEIRVARTVENGLYLAVLALWVLLALALFHGLRMTRPAAALFGSALNIVGLAVLAAGAIPHVVTSRLSDLYHAAGVAHDEQATLVLLWQANQAMFDALLLVGLLVMPAGVILFGLAMRQDPAYGKVAGNLSVARNPRARRGNGHAGRSALGGRRTRRLRPHRLPPRRWMEDLSPLHTDSQASTVSAEPRRERG
jgi:hypothetical protein